MGTKIGAVQQFDATQEGLHDGAQVRWVSYGHQGARIVHEFPELARGAAKGVETYVPDHVFDGTILIGCGTPNTAVTVYDPDDADGPSWKRLDAFMFFRDRGRLRSDRHQLQAGVYFELQGLDDSARGRLLEALADQEGKRAPSCAYLNAQALHQAGFTLGNGRALTGIYRPSRLARLLWRHGLSYEGRAVQMRIVNTTRFSVADHFRAVWDKEATSLWRTLRKQYCAARGLEYRPPGPGGEVVPRRNWGGREVSLMVSRPTRLGVWLGYLWGRHPEYRVDLPRLSGDWSAIKDPLDVKGGKGFSTFLKRKVLFRPSVVNVVNRIKISKWDRIDGVPIDAAMEMMNPVAAPGEGKPLSSSDAVTWNAVVVHEGPDQGYQLRLTPLNNQDPLSQASKVRRMVDWVMAKHVMLSNFDEGTVWGSEGWVSDSPNGRCLHYNSESGSYQPKIERAIALSKYLGDLGIPSTYHHLDGAARWFQPLEPSAVRAAREAGGEIVEVPGLGTYVVSMAGAERVDGSSTVRQPRIVDLPTGGVDRSVGRDGLGGSNLGQEL